MSIVYIVNDGKQLVKHELSLLLKALALCGWLLALAGGTASWSDAKCFMMKRFFRFGVLGKLGSLPPLLSAHCDQTLTKFKN